MGNPIQYFSDVISAAHFIVFREKRRMVGREIFREKWAAKNSQKIAGKNGKKWSEIDLKKANFHQFETKFEFIS